jgi:parallel beta-helix repeat protein
MSARLRLHAALATVILLAAMLALVGSGVVTLSSAEAAKQPKCGDTITKDTTLHKDLVDCPNNGIVIGADDVTLDLNGHLVDGDGTENSGCDPNTAVCDGGLVDDGHDGITVKHGRVHEFATGVLFGKSSPGRVRDNRVLDVSATRNQFVGLGIFSSARSVVRDCAGRRSIAHDGGVGIALVDDAHVRIVRNSFPNNGDHGIFMAQSRHNLIKGNTASGNRANIVLEHADRNQVRRNHSGRRKFEGILVASGKHNVIVRNRSSRAGGGGRGGDGIALEGGRANLVAHNVIARARGAGIRLGLPHPSVGAANNVVRGNRIRRSGDDGIVVEEKARHNLLKRNVVTRSGDDGFDINSHGTKLTDNRAVRNHDLGIEAVRGVTDGGGNVARHNGDPRQCTNIVCN